MASGVERPASSSSESLNVTDLVGGGWEEARGAPEEVEGRKGERTRGVSRPFHRKSGQQLFSLLKFQSLSFS